MLAQLLANELKDHGIDAYVDVRQTDGGGPFPDRLLRAIEAHDVFVCLVADGTFDSDWVRREIQHANEQGKILIPVFHESYQPLRDPQDKHVHALLQSDGVKILDVQNLYVDEAIAGLAQMIKQSVPPQPEAETPPHAPERPTPSRSNWLAIAGVILVLAVIAVIVLLSGVLGGDGEGAALNSTDVAGTVVANVTQTAIAFGPTPTNTTEPTETPTDPPPPTAIITPVSTLPSDPTVIRTSNADQIVELMRMPGEFYEIAWSPSGRMLALSRPEGLIWVVDTVNWDSEPREFRGHTDSVYGLMWNSNGTQLASASLDGTVRVWDVAFKRETLILEGHIGKVSNVTWSRDDSRLASAGWDTTVRVWDAVTGVLLQDQYPDMGQVHGAVWNYNGSRLALEGAGGIRVWNVEHDTEIFNLGNGMTMTTSTDDAWIVVGTWDGPIYMWDAVSGELAFMLVGHTKVINDIAWSGRGPLLASASNDGTVRIWDAVNDIELVVLPEHGEPVARVAWSDDGTRLASYGLDDMVRIWGIP